MENLNLDINLMKLSRVGVASIHGIRCVIIPCEENDIFISQDQQTGKAKGAYLSVTAWAKKSSLDANGVDQYGNSHMIKQSFSKEFREAHPEVTQQSPIIGNGKPVKGQGSNAVNEVAAPDVSGQIDNGNDDLPF